MKKIKCPKCGEVFEIDNALYNSIADDIRQNEIIKQNYEKRFVEIEFKINVFNSLIKEDISKNKNLTKEERIEEIKKLKSEIDKLENERTILIQKLGEI